ncbi:MAG: S-methyl-5-thioribose-1-phosphate isomerase [Candidatus Helarchaeales archaeon]
MCLPENIRKEDSGLSTISPLDEKGKFVKIIDQNKLPRKLTYMKCRNWEQIAVAIEQLSVRGAPAIGVAAAMGLALAALHSTDKNFDDVMKTAAVRLRKTRPTAVNLFWAIDRIMRIVELDLPVEERRRLVIQEAGRMREEDIEINMKIGENGKTLIDDGDVILTHCNTGTLATVKHGTALGVIRSAWNEGKRIQVIADETRPKLQGSRLTAFELQHDGIPVTVICDNMAGHYMSLGKINKIIVGADRIVRTGHVFNKIGTYSLAVLAKHHGSIPFYVAAPISTFDMQTAHDEVIIEDRDPREVYFMPGLRSRIVPKGVPIFNPAFDKTPPELITAIITERGIIWPPFEENIKKMLET